MKIASHRQKSEMLADRGISIESIHTDIVRGVVSRKQTSEASIENIIS
ncbi:MAG: hypothetical protein ABIR76_06405 [Polaromonas sp.]